MCGALHRKGRKERKACQNKQQNINRFESNSYEYERKNCSKSQNNGWKPSIKGTRIPVDAILKRLADGMTISDILEEYPNITEEDIKAALTYVSEVIAGEQIIPMVEVA